MDLYTMRGHTNDISAKIGWLEYFAQDGISELCSFEVVRLTPSIDFLILSEYFDRSKKGILLIPVEMAR